MHAYMQELLVPLFKSLLIHIIIVPLYKMQLTVAKMPSQNFYVLVKLNTVHSVSIFLHGLYVHNGLAYNRAMHDI